MQALVSVWWVHFKDMQGGSSLCPIRLMAVISSLALQTKPLGFGMQTLVNLWQVHFNTQHLSCLLPILLMGVILSLAVKTIPLGFGMQALASV